MPELMSIVLGAGTTFLIAVALFAITVVGVRVGLRVAGEREVLEGDREPEGTEPAHAAIWNHRQPST